MKALIASIAFLLALPAAAADLIEKTSPHDVATTADRLVAAIEKAGAKVAARIDHAANAASVGTEMEPTVLVVFGNPKIGTPIIMSDRRAALDLPVRVLVYADGGETKMIATDPTALAARYDAKAEQAVTTMTGAINKLMDAAAATE